MSDPTAAAGGTSRTLDRQQVMALVEPQIGWLIDRGVVDVFAATSAATPSRPHRFLYTARAGDVAIGLTGGAHPLVAVALEPTQVSHVDLDGPDCASTRAAVASWGRRLARAVGDSATPPPEPAGSTAELVRFWRHWTSARLSALEGLDANHTSQSQALHQEVSARAARSAVRRLLAVTSGRGDEPPVPDGSPLYQVVAAVGQRLGLSVRPPDRSEAGSDELGAIQRRSRFHARQVLLNPGWWTRDNGPVVGRLLADGRPVALLPDGPHRYTLFDPSTGTRATVDARSAATVAPLAHSLYRRLPDGPVTPATLVAFGLRGRARDAVTVAAAGLLVTTLSMVAAPATALILDVAVPDANRALLAQLGFGLLAAAVGRTLFEVSQAFASMRLETAAAASTQSAIWARVLELRLPFLRGFSTGDLHSRIAAVDGIQERLSAGALRAAFAGAVSLMNVGLLFWYGAWMAWVALLLLAAVAGVTLISGAVAFRAQHRLQQLSGESLGLTMQIVQNVVKLRVAAAEERAFERWTAIFAEQQRMVWRIQRLQDAVNVVLFVLPAAALAMLFGLANGSRSLASGGLTPGSLLAFSVALGALVGGITVLSSTLIESLDVLTLWRRARPLLQAEPEVQPFQLHPGRLRGELALDQVTFRYRPDGPPILDRVSLRAAPGEFVALVGPSGGGKSTMLQILLGFVRPESGTVAYDGHDLAGLDVQAVRRQLGVVLQQSRVMAASIFENIAVGAKLSLTDAWEAARQAGFAADIESFPMSMHTFVTEGGTNLSGGQRQRLLIARALARKPRVVIFDEATSALDNQTQAVVSRSLESLGVTRIVIAHRLSTIRHADRIYVIEKGRIVEQGRFEELAAAGGLFDRLMTRQAL